MLFGSGLVTVDVSDTGQLVPMHKQRATTIESTNAQMRTRGLRQFRVRSQLKACGVLPWQALAHNLARMRSLNIALQS